MKVSFLGNEITLIGNQLQVGDTIKDFRTLCPAFEEVDSKNFKKRKKLFLSIPSIDTNVCATETGTFSNILKDKDIDIFVISLDLPFALKRWLNENDDVKNINFLSDVKFNEFSKNTGTLIEEMHILTRAVFLTDENNKILHVEYINEITEEPDYNKVLEKI